MKLSLIVLVSAFLVPVVFPLPSIRVAKSLIGTPQGGGSVADDIDIYGDNERSIFGDGNIDDEEANPGGDGGGGGDR